MSLEGICGCWKL